MFLIKHAQCESVIFNLTRNYKEYQGITNKGAEALNGNGKALKGDEEAVKDDGEAFEGDVEALNDERALKRAAEKSMNRHVKKTTQRHEPHSKALGQRKGIGATRTVVRRLKAMWGR